MTIKDTIRKYTNDLKLVTHIPAKEVEMLMMYLLEKNTIWLHLNYNKEFEQEKELEKLVKKRATNYPMEYLTNKASFYGEVFIVQEGVLIPRPETELLIDNALEVIKNINNKKETINVLEIGTGSGIISVMLALLIENIKIIAVDINEKALKLALKNAQKHGVEGKIEFRLSNLYEKVTETNIDLTISNPPYIANDYKLPQNVNFEPSNALFGGRVGDELLKEIIDQTNRRNIEYLLCEMGFDQKNPLTNYLEDFNTKSFSFYQDYEKFDRGFTIQFKK